MYIPIMIEVHAADRSRSTDGIYTYIYIYMYIYIYIHIFMYMHTCSPWEPMQKLHYI